MPLGPSDLACDHLLRRSDTLSIDAAFDVIVCEVPPVEALACMDRITLAEPGISRPTPQHKQNPLKIRKERAS